MELEEEITWRRDEIRHLNNQLMASRDQLERKRFRRALVLMLYAHYEGFCRNALLIYVSHINRESLRCEQAVAAVVAGAWTELFRALDNTDRKSAVFRNSLPEDPVLHRFSRRIDFVAQLDGFRSATVSIPDDSIDTESNLWPEVLRKNLFRLGLDHEVFADHDSDISHLLNRRNNIAHGEDRDGMDEADYNRLQSAVFTVMEDMLDLIFQSAQNRVYLSPPLPASPA